MYSSVLQYDNLLMIADKFLCTHVTVVIFNFRQPVYMFMENVGTGSVCVEKIGETDQAITMIINGGK